jgi:hypothetical protein
MVKTSVLHHHYDDVFDATTLRAWQNRQVQDVLGKQLLAQWPRRTANAAPEMNAAFFSNSRRFTFMISLRD